MKDIDKVLENFNQSQKLINEDLSAEENLINIFNKLDDANKEKLLSYASDLYYSHQYQNKVKKIPVLNLDLKE